MALFRVLASYLPASLRRRLEGPAEFLRMAVDRPYRERRMWLLHEYGAIGNRQREQIFLEIARFCHINRPIEGYYFEFGCHSGRTMKMAWRHSRHLFNWTYVAFDSFEGLPDIAPIDKQLIWEKGKLATAEGQFAEMMHQAGMPSERLKIVKGFYDRTLTDELAATLLPTKAAVIYVDCDLYMSTRPVLRFIRQFLQPGTVIVFDDWNCFLGDPLRGERRAWDEFCRETPTLRFEPFVRTGEAQSFVYLGDLRDLPKDP